MGASAMVGNLMAVADVAALWAEAEKHAERARRRKTKKEEEDGPDANRSVRATQEVTGKRLGEVAEAAFLAKASDLGFRVAKPWGDSDPYDFIVETGGRLWKVQVKSAHRPGEDGSYSFRAHGHSLRADEIDALVAYVVPENAWYVFPVKVVRLLRSLKLFTGSRKRRSKFEKYREAWWILRGEGGS